MPQIENTAPASSFIGRVRGADGSSGEDRIASAARNAASGEAAADGIADTDEDGNGSAIVIVIGLGTTAVAIITITIPNRDGVIDDPVGVRDRDDHERGDGIGDGRIDDAGRDGAQHRAGRRSRGRRRGGGRHRRDAKRRGRGAPLRVERRWAAP